MTKTILALIILTLSQLAHANVIELDNHNIAHCQEQLKNDSWEKNVLMLYAKDAPGTKKFRAIYEAAAKAYPKRHLYALKVFDPKTDAKENKRIWKTVKACLTDMWYGNENLMGKINAKTPAILCYDYDSATVGLASKTTHAVSTKDDLLVFIGEKTSEQDMEE